MEHLKPMKGRMWLLLTILLGVIVVMFMLKQCSQASGDIDSPRAGGDTIEVAIEIAPISLTTSGDTLSGDYYNIMRQISAQHGLVVNFTPFSHIEDAYDGLESGRFDVLIADQPVTSQLRERFLYTEPIALDHEVLVQLCDSISGVAPILSQNDLRGDTVWIPTGSPFRQRIVNLSHEIGDTIYVIEDPEYGAEQLVMLTAIGEIPRAVVNSRTANKLAKRYPKLDMSVDISLTQFQAWAVCPVREELRDSLNVWLSTY